MRFIYNKFSPDSKIHATDGDSKVFLCTGKEPKNSNISWQNYWDDPAEASSYFHHHSRACKRCVREMYREVSLTEIIK